jgi:membrane-bound lytic murein transglycosylase B
MPHTPFSRSAHHILTSLALVLLSAALFIQQSHAAATKASFNSLQQRLIKDGFNEKWINTLYSRPEVKFETRGVSRYSRHNEAKLDYSQFLSKSNINKAKTYMEAHQTALDNAEKKYGVEKEFITAIFLVETRLGTYTGKNSILNTLSTMSALGDPKVRDILWKEASGSGQKKKDFNAWANKKSGWAYKELKAYLTYTKQSDIDPVKINGSYAGAMGIGQFMPTNIIWLAKDGDNDGKIDLFNDADAIASTANYLKHYGWKPGLDRKKQFKVLYHYNHSEYYVNTLLGIADRLRT